ncbi:hypothetical protein [Hydrogenimonas sp.]
MSLKEVRLIRILIWILLYLVILFVLIFTVVIPSVKAYKRINGEFVQKKAEFMAAQQEHDEIYDRYKVLQSRHRKVIEAFENPWNEKVFVQKAQSYFQKIDLKPIDINSSEPYFKIYEINAMTKMESPQNFYRFLDALPAIPYVVEADFPIAFRARGGEIEGVFRIRVYEEKGSGIRPQSAESNVSSAPSKKR